MPEHRTFAIVGLGRMGGNLSLQALAKGWQVVGYTIGGPRKELIDAGLRAADSLEALQALLPRPRVVFAYIPAGPSVDALLETLSRVLEPGDIVVDGGNSYWGDSIRRHERLKQAGLNFVDLGTSGGISGARDGACFMAGGEDAAVRAIEPLLQALAVPGGYVHAGPPGAGHFTKLVHNGIEFGMLQAIGEGMDLLESWPIHRLGVEKVLQCWRNGSVIRSWLIDLMEQEYREHGGLEKIPSFVEDTGEVNWLVSDAIRMEVPTPVIAQAVMQLFASRDDSRKWARAIALMRRGFGGHPLGPDPAIARERESGQVGGFVAGPAADRRKKAA